MYLTILWLALFENEIYSEKVLTGMEVDRSIDRYVLVIPRLLVA